MTLSGHSLIASCSHVHKACHGRASAMICPLPPLPAGLARHTIEDLLQLLVADHAEDVERHFAAQQGARAAEEAADALRTRRGNVESLRDVRVAPHLRRRSGPHQHPPLPERDAVCWQVLVFGIMLCRAGFMYHADPPTLQVRLKVQLHYCLAAARLEALFADFHGDTDTGAEHRAHRRRQGLHLRRGRRIQSRFSAHLIPYLSTSARTGE